MGTKTDPGIFKSMKLAGRSLGLFAIVSTAIVAVTFFGTEDQILENEKQALLKSLHVLIPQSTHDNDLFVDTIDLNISMLSYRNKPVTIYRARKDGLPSAAIFNVTAPDGYTGAIRMLVAINIDNSIAGVRVISHKETPGLGDAIDIEKSDWITNFDGHSLSNPRVSHWRVKKDGGHFDQLTGATITPRAIVKMVKKTLQYFSEHHQAVFASANRQVDTGKSHEQP